MNINCFSVTFWFNIYKEHNDLLSILQKEFKNEYNEFNVYDYTDNLVTPIINAINDKKMTNLIMSQINLQYFMDKVTMDDFDEFQNKVLKIYELLINNGVEVSHSALYINADKILENGLDIITKHTINKNFINDDLVDITLKLGTKHEDLFYKIITILNKKQVQLPQKVDENGRIIPIPLVSWYDAKTEQEMIEISYEINDKYSFDYTKDYHTTEFYLNKMLYLLHENFEDDINNVLKK